MEIPGLQTAGLMREVAQMDYRAYLGSLDAKLYWQYFSSPGGCERMWREAVGGGAGQRSGYLHPRALLGFPCNNHQYD